MKKLQILVAVMLVMLLGIIVTQAQDNYGDGRINQVSHFGGDALYCEAGVGCWALDKNGNQLWDLSQAAIDEMFAVACETGVSVFEDVGVGTYGMMTFHISCYEGLPKTLEMFGYDEWGKLNSVKFAQSYEPVGAEEPEPLTCQIRQGKLASNNFNNPQGSLPTYYLFLTDDTLLPFGAPIESSTSEFPGVPYCIVPTAI